LSDQELLTKLEKNLETQLSTGKFACVVTESGIITGGGSTYVAPRGFIELVDKLCEKYNVLLILDEIGKDFQERDLYSQHTTTRSLLIY